MASAGGANGHSQEKPADTSAAAGSAPAEGHHHHHHLADFVPGHTYQPTHHLRLPRGIQEDGESGRRGLTPHCFKIILRSSCVPSALCNILWPFVPLAIVWSTVESLNHLHSTDPNQRPAYLVVFVLNYLAIIPSANLLGFAGQELARKLPKVLGVLLETFLGGLVEIILFAILITRSPNESFAGEANLRNEEEHAAEASSGEATHKFMARAVANEPRPSYIPIIQAAILGSVLANLLLCLGICFIAGGLRHASQKFSKDISETGSGLLLMAAFALTIPRAFSSSLSATDSVSYVRQQEFINKISRAGAIILIVAFLIYVVFQMFSHHGIMSAIFEEDELRDLDRHKDLAKDKLTLTECIIACVLAIALVSLHAYFLVEQIEGVIENNGVSDMFLGLILVPVVEKFAEHLTAIDEAWDNTMNLALAHVLGATLQTVLFNTGLVVIIGWCMNKPMNLDFNSFHVIIVVLAILAVGSFLRDGESTWLEGSICVLIYILIAVASYYYPNLSTPELDGLVSLAQATATGAAVLAEETAAAASETSAAHAAETTQAAVEQVVHNAMRLMMRT